MNKKSLSSEQRRKNTLSIILGVICVIYVIPVLMVVINSFKLNTYVKTDTFALPTGEMYAGFDNFIKGMTFGNYPFIKSVCYSVVITLLLAFVFLHEKITVKSAIGCVLIGAGTLLMVI